MHRHEPLVTDLIATGPLANLGVAFRDSPTHEPSDGRPSVRVCAPRSMCPNNRAGREAQHGQHQRCRGNRIEHLRLRNPSRIRFAHALDGERRCPVRVDIRGGSLQSAPFR